MLSHGVFGEVDLGRYIATVVETCTEPSLQLSFPISKVCGRSRRGIDLLVEGREAS